MKAQLSLEVLLYAALAGLSLLFSLGAVAKAAQKIGGSMDSFKISQFVNRVNSALLDGSSAAFGAFVPNGLCGAVAYNNSLVTSSGTFFFVEPLSISGEALCPDGTYANFEISPNQTNPYLVRV